MITMTAETPAPSMIKRKALLAIKARVDSDANEEDAVGEFFPTGIENEVVFMEITGKTLGNLYSSCQVSAPPQFLFPGLSLATNSFPIFGREEI